MAKKTDLLHDLRHIVLRITRVHYLYVVAYMLSIIIFDSWNLLNHERVAQRWTVAGALVVVNIVIWYLAKSRVQSKALYWSLLSFLITCDILFAALNVYWTRGMASKYVFLFVVPIITAALARSRSLLVATAALSSVAYSIAMVRFFFGNYGQGVRAELYGEIFFFSAMFFVLSGLLMVFFRPAKD